MPFYKNSLTARIGSLTANKERFIPWRSIHGDDLSPKGMPELETMIKGVFDKQRFLPLIRDFTVFGDIGEELIKIIAGYHQFHAVQYALNAPPKQLTPKETKCSFLFQELIICAHCGCSVVGEIKKEKYIY
jgi:type I site-specific restriction-modification system R (restriction) subunit